MTPFPVRGGQPWNPVPGCTPDAFAEPLETTEPRVFVNAESDLFHPDINRFWINEVFGIMARVPQHTFQLATSHTDRAHSLLNDPSFIHRVHHRATTYGLPWADWVWPLPNVQISYPD